MEKSSVNQSSELKEESVSFFERITNSSILKLFIIFILTMLMLIPMSLINDLVEERKNRENKVSEEVATKWGRDQVLSAPILAVPYERIVDQVSKDSKGKETIKKVLEEDWVFLLPDNSTVKTDIKPESLKRGIYSTVVYNASIDISGSFGSFNMSDLPVDRAEMKWSKGKLIFGVEDVKGLSTFPVLTLGDSTYSLHMNNHLFDFFPNTMVADISLEKESGVGKIPFGIKLDLRGSKSLNFLPLANQTTIEAAGEWDNPSFNGGFLPEDRIVEKNSFKANWGIPSFGRKLPAQWTSSGGRIYNFTGISLTDDYVTSNSVSAIDHISGTGMSTDQDMVQINFLAEVNNYQKANRAAKYGILVIVLTFASLFFTEIIKKKRIHMIQYILIGAGMVLFYGLLLAISEHLGFNIAYLLAAAATILLIASFVQMITHDMKTSLLFAAILSLFYSFIYVLMQLRDYSLIVGMVGVFIILAVLMRVSGKINWYQFDKK